MPKTKTNLHDSIARLHDPTMRERATEFVEWLREIKREPRCRAHHSYKVNCGPAKREFDQRVMQLDICRDESNDLIIDVYLPNFKMLNAHLKTLNETQRQIYHDAVSRGKKCNLCTGKDRCAAMFSFTMDGVKYAGRCFLFMATFTNPTNEEIEVAKTLVRMQISDRLSHGTANRPKFDAKIAKFARIKNESVTLISAPDGMTDFEHANCLFDGTYETKFCTNKYDEIVFRLDDSTELFAYSFVTANDSANLFNNGRLPNKWTLYGAKNNDGEWIAIDTRTNDDVVVYNYVESAFEIVKSAEYQYYKLATEGEGIYQFSQIHLYTK